MNSLGKCFSCLNGITSLFSSFQRKLPRPQPGRSVAMPKAHSRAAYGQRSKMRPLELSWTAVRVTSALPLRGHLLEPASSCWLCPEAAEPRWILGWNPHSSRPSPSPPQETQRPPRWAFPCLPGEFVTGTDSLYLCACKCANAMANIGEMMLF